VPSQSEFCRSQAAECRRRAEQATDASMRNELLEIAKYWDKLRSAYEAFARSRRLTHHRISSRALVFLALAICTLLDPPGHLDRPATNTAPCS
jgi:hypothetical protein